MVPFDSIESQKKNLIRFLQQIVKIPSQDGVDFLKPVIKAVSRELKKFGFKPILIKDRTSTSILCFCDRKGTGKTLWLDAPLDTAAVGNINKWKYSPFSGKIAQGKLYGRGSGDCKAAIAIFVYSAAAVFNSGKNIKGQLILTFDSGEQNGDFTGMRNILKKGIKADACIIGYPNTEGIVIGSRGFLRLNVTTFGKSAHTGARYKVGINAIHKMVQFLNGLEKLKLSHKKSRLFNFGPKLTTSIIEGGYAINIVPDECKVKIDIRLVPFQTKNRVLEEINNLVKKLKKEDPCLKIEIKPYLYEPAFQTSERSEIVRILKKNAEKILKKRVKLIACGPANSGNIIGNKKIDTIAGFGVNGDNFHSENEYIELDSIIPVAKVYIKTILDFLT